MPPLIATFVFAIGILLLYILGRDVGGRTSKALWLPVVWLLINGSRPVSQWLGITSVTETDPSQYLDGSPVDRFIFTLLIVIGLIVIFTRARQVGALLRANGPIVLFYLYCLTSTLWSIFPDVAFKRWTKAAGDLVMVILVLTDADPSAAIKRVLVRVGFVLLPLSILFIRYYPDLARAYNPWTYTVIYVGVATNKNILGMVSMLIGLASVWRLLRAYQDRTAANRSRFLIAHGAVLLMAMWLLKTAGSATSLSCFLMGGMVMAVTSVPSLAQRRALVHVVVATVLMVAVCALFLMPESGVLEAVGRDPSLTGRTELWKTLIALSGSPLFGVGYESFWLGPRLQTLWNIWWWHPQEAHNGYFEVYLELGWVGEALLAFVIVTGYRNGIAALRRLQETASLRLAYFVVALIYNLTEHGLREMHPIWIFLLWASLAIPETATPKEPSRSAIDELGKSPVLWSQTERMVGVALR